MKNYRDFFFFHLSTNTISQRMRKPADIPIASSVLTLVEKPLLYARPQTYDWWWRRLDEDPRAVGIPTTDKDEDAIHRVLQVRKVETSLAMTTAASHEKSSFLVDKSTTVQVMTRKNRVVFVMDASSSTRRLNAEGKGTLWEDMMERYRNLRDDRPVGSHSMIAFAELSWAWCNPCDSPTSVRYGLRLGVHVDDSIHRR